MICDTYVDGFFRQKPKNLLVYGGQGVTYL